MLKFVKECKQEATIVGRKGIKGHKIFQEDMDS